MIYYICPSCKRRTREMRTIEGERHNATPDERRARPGMEQIDHEVLLCPCGQRLTWYTVEEVGSVV